MTLDNSRSNEAVTYVIRASDSNGEGPAFEKTIQVPAGAIQTVTVPVTEDTLFVVEGSESPADDFLPGAILAFAVLAIDCIDDDDLHDRRPGSVAWTARR